MSEVTTQGHMTSIFVIKFRSSGTLHKQSTVVKLLQQQHSNSKSLFSGYHYNSFCCLSAKTSLRFEDIQICYLLESTVGDF